MRSASIFWALLAMTLALYLVIVLWSLPRISAEADGLAPFDMRPTGYDLEEARTFLSALSDSGRGMYLGAQHVLDVMYPALLAATLACGFALLYRGPLLWAMLVLAVCVMAFDWLENLAVAGLLKTVPEGLTEAQVARASLWSVLKSAATSLAWVALLAGAVVALIRRRRRVRRPAPVAE